jgi:hypothetical protein
VKGQPFGDNGVVTVLETFDEPWLQGNAAFSRQVRGATGAVQQSLHPTRPVFLLDFDESLILFLEGAIVAAPIVGLPRTRGDGPFVEHPPLQDRAKQLPTGS